MAKKKKDIFEGIKFPQYINTSERSTSVIGVITDVKDTYIDGKGYLRDDSGKKKDANASVWIFCSKEPNKRVKNTYPYFWIKDGKFEYSNPSDFIKSVYIIDNMRDLSLVNIIDKTIPGEKLYNEQEILDINAASSTFTPRIEEGDDFLKQIVKIIINEKKLDINKLKSRVDIPYMLPNMRTALTNKTKMSVVYFMAWMELLGCSFDIIVKDNGEDPENPLTNDHIFDIEKNKTYININGKPVELDVKQYYKINETDDENTEEVPVSVSA